MSAPNTNLEKQERRHRGPLIGMIAGVVFVAVLLLGYTFFIATPDVDSVDTTAPGEAVPTASPDPQVNAPPSDSLPVAPRSGQERAPDDTPAGNDAPGTMAPEPVAPVTD